MPCDTVSLISVDLAVADKETLETALQALNLKFQWSGSVLYVQTPAGQITINNGVATYTNKNCQSYVNKIKQMYSTKTIERIAKKYKYNIIKGPENQIVIRKY